jgi:hypothetical protein
MLADQGRTGSYLDTDPFSRGGNRLSQTPTQSLLKAHFWVNLIAVTILNFGINLGITVLSFLSHDRTGLWQSESFVTIDGHRVYYADAPIFVDVLLTTFFLSFFVTIASTGGVRKAIVLGKTLPIAGNEYRRLLRYFGVAIRNVFARGAVFGVYALLTLYPLTLFVFMGECNRGAMLTYTPPGSEDPRCYMSRWDYTFFKAAWCSLLTALLYPLVYLGGLHRDGLSDDEYQKFLHQHDASTSVVAGDTLGQRYSDE